MEIEGREVRQPYTKAKFKKIFSSWHIYTLTLAYVCFNNGAAGATPVFAQYLKDSTNPKYTIAQINDYPTGTSAVQIVTTLAYAWSSDTFLKGSRWPPVVFGGVINIICYISLIIWDIPVGWKFAVFNLIGAGFGLSGLLMAFVLSVFISG